MGPGNATCASCGLWRDRPEGTVFLPPELSPNWEERDLPVVLVVVPWSRLSTGTDHEGGDLLRVILNGMEGCRWAITGTLRCPPRGKFSEVAPATHHACVQAHLPLEVGSLDPKALVLLGEQPCQAFLGSSAPKRFTAMLRRTVKGAEGWPPILVGRSPFYHDPSDDRDAFDEWVELFTRAERIATGKDSGQAFSYEEVSDPARAIEICSSLPLDFTWDTEYDAHEDDPNRRTYWFEGAQNVCWSVEWLDAAWVVRTATFIPPAANDPRVWEAAFRGRRPCAHFAKVDFQVPFATLNVDLFQHVRRLETGEIEYRDPGQEIHLCDQSKAGLGILTLAMDKRGAMNWKQPLHDKIARENEKLGKLWQARSSWANRLGDAWKAVLAWEKLEERVEDKRVVAEHATSEKKRNNALAWLAANPLPPRPEDPPEPDEPPMPPGTCGFGSAVPLVYHYCAEDSYWTSDVLRNYVPQVKEKLGGCGPIVTRLLARAVELTCEVERVGLPVDMNRVQALQGYLEDVQRQAKLDMLGHPAVRNAVCSLTACKMDLAKGRDPLDAALEFLNTGSPLFRLAFAREQGLDVVEHAKKFRTDSGEPSFNKKALSFLCKPAIPWEEASEDVRLWRAFAKLKNARDLQTKTKMFRFVERGYIRTDYKVVKVTKSDSGESDSQGTNTGRLSAGFLQGLKKDPAFRDPFVAPEGWVFLEIDYATLEPRILAHLCGITEWQDWFRKGFDLYCGMANKMFGRGVNIDHPDYKAVAKELKACITPEFRDQVMKRCFLAQMYMQGPKSLAEATGLPLEQTEQFAEDFHRSFPQLKKFQALLWQNMMAGKPVITPFGRQSYSRLPSMNDPNRDEKLADEHRHNWNLPNQATGSDTLIWLGWNGMRELKLANRWGGPQARINGEVVPIEVVEKRDGVRKWGAYCNLVHDAIWSLVRVEHFTEFARLVIRHLEARKNLPFKMTSPLLAEPKAGRVLSNLQKVDPHTLALPPEALEI